LWSGTKDAKAVLDRFKNDPLCRTLVCNNASGSEGLNLQHANAAIYYEMPLSSITWQQGLKRIHRTGQKETCFYYLLMVKNSVDERIKKSLEDGTDIFESLIKDHK
jgi:SNF2 family DNA or RNA helicase